LPYFDYIAPMVYPSHYPPTFNGWKKPATVPYELIKFVMEEGVKRVVAASSTPNKLRPWLQDFDLGAVYTGSMVREQIQATYDVGLNTWMLWDASNKYTPSALENK
ncbi:MAG: putative glycoside hydrolase, partial [Patescibacteria group bacterium]